MREELQLNQLQLYLDLLLQVCYQVVRRKAAYHQRIHNQDKIQHLLDLA